MKPSAHALILPSLLWTLCFASIASANYQRPLTIYPVRKIGVEASPSLRPAELDKVCHAVSDLAKELKSLGHPTKISHLCSPKTPDKRAEQSQVPETPRLLLSMEHVDSLVMEPIGILAVRINLKANIELNDEFQDLGDIHTIEARATGYGPDMESAEAEAQKTGSRLMAARMAPFLPRPMPTVPTLVPPGIGSGILHLRNAGKVAQVEAVLERVRQQYSVEVLAARAAEISFRLVLDGEDSPDEEQIRELLTKGSFEGFHLQVEREPLAIPGSGPLIAKVVRGRRDDPVAPGSFFGTE